MSGIDKSLLGELRKVKVIPLDVLGKKTDSIDPTLEAEIRKALESYFESSGIPGTDIRFIFEDKIPDYYTESIAGRKGIYLAPSEEWVSRWIFNEQATELDDEEEELSEEGDEPGEEEEVEANKQTEEVKAAKKTRADFETAKLEEREEIYAVIHAITGGPSAERNSGNQAPLAQRTIHKSYRGSGNYIAALNWIDLAEGLNKRLEFLGVTFRVNPEVIEKAEDKTPLIAPQSFVKLVKDAETAETSKESKVKDPRTSAVKRVASKTPRQNVEREKPEPRQPVFKDYNDDARRIYLNKETGITPVQAIAIAECFDRYFNTKAVIPRNVKYVFTLANGKKNVEITLTEKGESLNGTLKGITENAIQQLTCSFNDQDISHKTFTARKNNFSAMTVEDLYEGINWRMEQIKSKYRVAPKEFMQK